MRPGTLGGSGEVHGLGAAAEVQVEPARKPVHQRCGEVWRTVQHKLAAYSLKKDVKGRHHHSAHTITTPRHPASLSFTVLAVR
jgi:hypothetical protein